MWVDKRRSWIATVVLGGFALPHIWTRTLAVTALSVLVTFVYREVPRFHYTVTDKPFVLIGLPLGIFLGFRNNTAYDRFWEGRKLWGSLVNTSRSLTRQLLTLIDGPDAEAEAVRVFETGLVHMLVAYVHALRHHLRGTDPFKILGTTLPAEEVEALRDEENVPMALLHRMGVQISAARKKNWLHAFHVPVLEQSLVSLTDIQGACERIKSTPMPYSYTVLMHRIVAVYCTLLPFGFAETLGWITPVVVLCVSYAFFGMDAIGDEIEQPFGVDINDLPLKSISRTIERNLRKRLGEPLPDPVVAHKGVLL